MIFETGIAVATSLMNLAVGRLICRRHSVLDTWVIGIAWSVVSISTVGTIPSLSPIARLSIPIATAIGLRIILHSLKSGVDGSESGRSLGNDQYVASRFAQKRLRVFVLIIATVCSSLVAIYSFGPDSISYLRNMQAFLDSGLDTISMAPDGYMRRRIGVAVPHMYAIFFLDQINYSFGPLLLAAAISLLARILIGLHKTMPITPWNALVPYVVSSAAFAFPLGVGLFLSTYSHGLTLVLLLTCFMMTSDRELNGAGRNHKLTLAVLLSAIAMVRPEGPILALLIVVARLSYKSNVANEHTRMIASAAVSAGLLSLVSLVPVVHMLVPTDTGPALLPAVAVSLVLVALSASGIRMTVGFLRRQPLVFLSFVYAPLIIFNWQNSRATLRTSAEVTHVNVLSDAWMPHGLLIVALSPFLFFGATRLLRSDAGYFLFAFVHVSALMAILRGGPYRIGVGDSFSRALLHAWPFFILLVLDRHTLDMLLRVGITQRLAAKRDSIL